MEELIKITESNGKRAVSARELHGFLEIDTKFSDWVKRMIAYGFNEGVDFSKMSLDYQMVDYALSLDCAKHWAMMQRSEKGMQARNYFIECEKKLVLGQFNIPKTLPEALRLYAGTLEELESKKEEVVLLDKLVDALEPKAKVYNQISDSESLLSLNDAAKSIGIGRNIMMKDLRRDRVLLRNNTPYQNFINSGLFEVKIHPVPRGAKYLPTPVTFVTGKGLTWLSKRYPKKEEKEITPKVKMI